MNALDKPVVVTAQQQVPASTYNPPQPLATVQPVVTNGKVKVYRTNDAAEQIYKDTIPLDKGGFQIIVIGTRNPDYVH